jgi:HEAT repeat protein
VSDSGETIQFYHQLLQEYFAAAYLHCQPLTPTLFDQSTYVQFNEVWLFWAGLNEKLVAQVAAFLEDKDSFVRRDAAEALVKIGASAVLPLIAALKDQNMLVRDGAASALGKIGDRRAVEPLMTVLNDEDWNVRYYATKALEELG